MYRSVFLKGQRLVKIQIEVVASRFYNAHATRTFHTKATPVVHVKWSRENLLMASGGLGF